MALNFPDDEEVSDFSVDPLFVTATIGQESAGDPSAVSSAGAQGLMQLMPATGQQQFEKHKDRLAELGLGEEYEPFNPSQNKYLGISYLDEQLKDFGDEKLALAAYNAGPGRVKGLQKRYGESFDDIAAHLPKETQDYVPKILKKYETLKKSPESGETETAALPNLAEVPPTAQGFAQSALDLISNPEFDTLPFDDKAQKLSQLYGAKKWDEDTYDVLKETMTNIWDAAPEKERPSLRELFGAPPMAEKGEDPKKVTESWKQDVVQNLLRNKVSPAIFGNHLDTYLEEASQDEIQAYNTRNRSLLSTGAGYAGNAVRELAKGIGYAFSKPAAGAVRLTSGGNKESLAMADSIEDAPESFLGKPGRDYLYVTNENGYLEQNPDGSPVTSWGSTASTIVEGTGQILGMLGGGGALRVAGVGMKALSAGIFSANSLTIANDSFRHVYEQTGGDVKKSYMASLFALPSAAVGSLGELAIVGKWLSPALDGLTGFSKTLAIASKYAGVEGAANAASDVVAQVGETGQTGEDIDTGRIGFAAGFGAIAGGIGGAVGTIGDSGRAEKAKKQAVLDAQQFQNSLNTTTTLNVHPNLVSKEAADALGMTITPGPKNTTILTRESASEGAVGSPDDLPRLIEGLRESLTPEEIHSLSETRGELLSKPNKTEGDIERIESINQKLSPFDKEGTSYINNVKVNLERPIAEILQQDPSLLPVSWNESSNTWEHPASGSKEVFLKDALFKSERVPNYVHDLSDTSNIKFIEKENFNVLGAVSKDRNTIATPTNLTTDTRQQVVAHELGHVISDKVKLSQDTLDAVNNALEGLKTKSKTSTAREVAQDVLLPGIIDSVKIPENIKVGELQGASKKALLSQKEFLANQIGAVILKRSGVDIGNYKILPEIEASLAKTKLPNVKSFKTSEGAKPENVKPEATRPEDSPKQESVTTKSEERSPTPRETELENYRRIENLLKEKIDNYQEPDPTQQGAFVPASKKNLQQQLERLQAKILSLEIDEIPVKRNESGQSTPTELPFDLKTGKQKETAFSETVTESVPSEPKTFYDVVSRTENADQIRSYVREVGHKTVLKHLQDPKNFDLTPNQRIVLTDEALSQAEIAFNENPTKANSETFFEARQVRSAVGTSAGQQLGLLRRFRGTESFGDFLDSVRETYKEAGQKEPEFNDFMLKELKQAYDKTQKLPDGVLRDNATQRLFEKTMKDQKLNWPDFITNSMRTNLLSGTGTQAINFTSGGWMGPLVTALSHPVMGRGLIWKAMWSAKDVAASNAKRILEGKSAYNLFGGMIDVSPLNVNDTSTPARAMASFYNKFGRTVWKTMGAVDAYMRTLSGEGYIASKKYKALKEAYGDNPGKFSAEVAKIVLSESDKQSAIAQATREGDAAGLPLSSADKMARAYEILRKGDTDETILSDAVDWTYSTSLLGKPANPVQSLLYGLFNSPVWESHPLLKDVRTVIQPFGRALVAISDYTQDFIPGNILVDKAYRTLSNLRTKDTVTPRSQALQDRLVAGQKIGTVIAATALGLSQGGLITITGDEEKQLGDGKGGIARTSKDFKESKQTGLPPFSVMLPNGFAFTYKDFPGLNAIFYGINKMNKSIASGTNPLLATAAFYNGAFRYAVPFLGGGTLNSPTAKLAQTLISQDTTTEKIQKALTDFGTATAKMLTPASGLLRDVKNAYDSTPEDTHQEFVTKMFKDVPGVAEALGSKPALDRFGDPVTRTGLERVPGIGRVASAKKEPTDAVWSALWQKGIIVPELPNKLKFTKSDFQSEGFQSKYEASRSERLGKAYAGALTPDEWYSFVEATGPKIKSAAANIANSSMTTEKAQKLLIERVKQIDDLAMKRYVRIGKF